LPFAGPSRLMKVTLIMPAMFGRGPNDQMVWSYRKYQAFQSMQTVFQETALFTGPTMNLTGTEEPERLHAEQVSAGYFSLLGIHAAAGRTFLPEEDSVPDRDLVAVISYGLWRRRYGSDPSVVGRSIELDTRKYTIVGVLPRGFQGLTASSDVWIPIHAINTRMLAEAQSHTFEMVARLKPGVTVEQAETEAAQLGPAVDRAIP